MALHRAPRRSPGRPNSSARPTHPARSTRSTGTLVSAASAASALVALPVIIGAPAADAAAPDPSTQVLSLTNAQRAQHGCHALVRNRQIDGAAQGYAQQMSASDSFSHNGPDGSTFDQRIRRAGYARPGGENIAEGQSSAGQVVQDWMNSPGHRRNMLDCSFTTIGIGHTRDGYWVQDFGR